MAAVRTGVVSFCRFRVLTMSAAVAASDFQDGTEPVVKDVHPGDSVHSLLSILDIITVSSSFFSRFCFPLTLPVFFFVQSFVTLRVSPDKLV